MKLYEIKEEYDVLLRALEDAEDEEQVSALSSQLHDLEWERSEKLENIAKYMQALQWDMDSIDSEVARLSSLKSGKSNTKDRLKNYISYNLTQEGIQKMETDLFKFSFRKSESVEVIDQEAIPQDYMKEKVTLSVDRASLKRAIKSWVEIAWAVINEKQNLQIK